MRLLVRALGLGFVCSVIAAACGGGDFSSSGTAGQGGTSASGGTGATGGSTGGDSTLGGMAGVPGGGGTTSGSGGTAGGGTTLCAEAQDCVDADACTIDSCGADGICVHAAKCTGDQPLCCDGVCGQCCSKTDCDDQVDCTDDECFAGFCTNTPGTCANKDQYCSPTGCVAREGCTADTDCDDSDPCTDDTCVNRLCNHASCPGGGTCCPGQGCGTCCSDSQCPHDDACNPSKCGADLKCSTSPLCGAGEQCCPSPDGTTAECGSCCSAGDCPDDGVACTVAKCKAGTDGTLACSNEPDASLCKVGQTCDPKKGCSSNQCTTAADCAAPLACQTVACNNGKCEYPSVSCSHGETCCQRTGKCQACCSNDQCSGGSLCCPETGTCAQCCQDSDCSATVQPLALPLDGGGGGQCTRPVCKEGACTTQTGTCPLNERCCQGVGCISSTAICGGPAQ
jgi:hypothetical protein